MQHAFFTIHNFGKFKSSELVEIYVPGTEFTGYIHGLSPRSITFVDEEEGDTYNIALPQVITIRRVKEDISMKDIEIELEEGENPIDDIDDIEWDEEED